MVALIRENTITKDLGYGKYRLGVFVALASVVMLFTSLTSAYIVRAAVTNDWVPLPAPRMLWISTALLLVSSATIEMARRAAKRNANEGFLGSMAITTLLGIGFLFSQITVWRQFVKQGVYVSSNPHSSFFYLLTATHGVHLAGGLLALIYLLIRYQRRPQDEIRIAKRSAAADAVALYWHFMDALWLYLVFLLFFWR